MYMINSQVENMNDLFSEVMSKSEKDFLAAYSVSRFSFHSLKDLTYTFLVFRAL